MPSLLLCHGSPGLQKHIDCDGQHTSETVRHRKSIRLTAQGTLVLWGNEAADTRRGSNFRSPQPPWPPVCHQPGHQCSRWKSPSLLFNASKTLVFVEAMVPDFNFVARPAAVPIKCYAAQSVFPQWDGPWGGEPSRCGLVRAATTLTAAPSKHKLTGGTGVHTTSSYWLEPAWPDQ